MSSQTESQKSSWQKFPSVDFFGVPVLKVNEQQCVQVIMDELDSGRGGWCVTIHLNMLRQITLDPEIKTLVANSTFSIADGMPLVWASRLQKNPLPERVCGSNLIYTLSAEAARRNRSIFLLGGNPGSAEKTAKILEELYPGLNIAGIYCPPLGFEQDLGQIATITESIRSSQPDIVYVALGFPKQERLIALIRHACAKTWWMGVGFSFSYVAEEFKRPPIWIQKLGLESLYRVILEPKRLGKRYLLENPPFAARLLVWSCLKGLKWKNN
ncbi:MAG: N-acetylglucosaminyldiphosphoundecaprenol N-acetyl-beta-D-mannosaminyltransferase [Chroococcopsis gigantea SAG 12.99]|jgi:N-acetylglucosaminyldiphosphoundecaprenol N-acetyl-beta-D-mannosaminyltransferase|nr:WecB/TagA/CpsF family glycosyltransferase [Chlorogloea purpurea SAG 13.99]MDV2999281.1 N-acetylglucosaminyldiphosphoundecaprenol N-acetyl-beta-D-mannosaminyltransferase [Chroococcopsis gigantea SAG 12.99]